MINALANQRRDRDRQMQQGRRVPSSRCSVPRNACLTRPILRGRLGFDSSHAAKRRPAGVSGTTRFSLSCAETMHEAALSMAAQSSCSPDVSQRRGAFAHVKYGCHWGRRSSYSTAQDLAAFAESLRIDKLLKPATRDEMSGQPGEVLATSVGSPLRRLVAPP
jgi:hypothetical protein